MISRSDVFEMHKMWNQGFTKRQIARQLQLHRGTVAKYLANPDPAIKKRQAKKSKLDPYRSMVEKMIGQYPTVRAPVVLQRLIDEGFSGEITIVRNLLRELRGQMANREPFIRFETGSGEQIQIDWGTLGVYLMAPHVESCTHLPYWKVIAVCSMFTSPTVSNNLPYIRDFLKHSITLAVYPRRLWWTICLQQ